MCTYFIKKNERMKHLKKLYSLILSVIIVLTTCSTLVTAVSYADEDAYTGGYIPAKVEFVSDNTIVVTQDYYNEDGTIGTNTKTITDGADLKAFVEHIELGEPYGAPEDFSSYKAMNPDAANDTYGKIYMYDYAVDNTESDRTYKTALVKFANLVDEILSARTSDLSDYEASDLITAWRKCYTASFSKEETPARWDAMSTARTNARAVRNYFNGNTFDEDLFDKGDVEIYNAGDLFTAVYTADTSKMTTSEIIYLNAEYERVASEISYSDTTAYMDEYYEALDKVTSYVKEDFTAAGWREVQELLEEAEDIAADAVSIYDWKEATEILKDAASVKGKPVDYTNLQDALIELFVGEKSSVIKPIYLGNDDEVYVYNRENFEVRNSYSQEWLDFAGDSTYGKVDGENAAYTEAYTLYKSARSSSTSVKQSELDEALTELLDAVDALVSNGDDIDEWYMVKLQGVVDKAEALVESDFNTTTRKWENFQEDVDKAKDVLKKANPSEAEVNRVTSVLEESLADIKSSAKAVPSADKKELNDLIKSADRLLTNISTQTGTQVAILREAVEDADEIYDRVGITGDKKATISEVKSAIADLTNAINGFNNPQGWYKEDGEWYYGVGAEVYADGWVQIGKTWFMFNADGTLKVNEWFKVGGKWYWANANGGLAVGWAKVEEEWYFFDQSNAMKTGWIESSGLWYYLTSSGKMAINTTVNGYKVNANGVCVL